MSGLYLALGPHSRTCPTIAGWCALGRNLLSGVFWRKFVTALAMGFSLLAQRVRRASNFQAIKINMLVFREYLARRPAQFVTARDCIAVDAGLFGPLRNGESLSPKGNPNITLPIVGLLFARSPLAILGGVMPFVINAINCMPRWARTHVCLEGKEIIPSGTDLNSPTSITGIMGCRWRIASGAHLKPDAIDRSFAFAVFCSHAA